MLKIEMILNNWYAKSFAEIFELLHSGEHGLTKEEAEKRLKERGLNKLPEAKADNLAVIFLRQFKSPLIYILFAAAFFVFVMNEIIDGSIILFVLMFNAVVGTVQEGRAQNTLLALKKFTETKAVVLRDNQELIIPDEGVVAGDVIILQPGDKVPADARVIFSNNLKVDEASLTGESEAVYKIAEKIPKVELPHAEQKNMVFKATTVVAGSGKAIVTATGLETAIGKISKEIAIIDTEIPLKADIRYLSRIILLAAVSISAFLFFVGINAGKPVLEMFKTVISLSVSIIPEGLPIVLTLVLASGVWRMSKQNALIKKLQAVEALGQAKIIAVDKTGTITRNEMTVQKFYVDGKMFDINGSGYEPKGEILLKRKGIDPLNHDELLLGGKIASFCADARAVFSPEEKQWRVFGDPTEAALLVFSEKIGFKKDDLESESPKIDEIGFDYKTKYHATLHKVEGRGFLTVVGAPEVILGLSSKIWRKGRHQQLTKQDKDDLESVFLKMSEDGLRVLGISFKETPATSLKKEHINELVFVGFAAMKDALRPEVSEAMKKAVSAGIRVVMITGDHKITARAIAKEAGIYRESDEILTGQEIDSFSDSELREKLERVSVFARVTPEHKLKIINAYRKRGEVVAMTGDGVNDAPSLVAADLGVAMGKIGTEVAKEASDIILLDDNFGSIVGAIEEGRSIYKTIKKVILYLFSTSIGEVLTITGALLLGYPLPILAGQIIWLNFVTDGFLDVALAMEPKEDGLLRGAFKRTKKYLVDSLMVKRMFVMALPMMIGTLLLFRNYFEIDLPKAWTISLTTLAVFQWFNAWNCRHESKSIFKLNPLSNKFLIGATIIVIFLQLSAVYNPLLQKILHTAPLSFSDWLLIVPVAASIVLFEEIRKALHRKKEKNYKISYQTPVL